MKARFLLFFTIAFAMIGSMSVFASDYVRIGLEKSYKGVASVSATNNDICVVANGKRYGVGVSGGYKMSHISKQYYKLNLGLDAYNDAKDKLSSYIGYNCVPILNDNGWNIYFTTDKEPQGNVSKVSTSNNAIVFNNNGANKFIVDTSDAVQILSQSGVLNLDKGNYRDSLELYVSGSSIVGINVINVEHYLYGVINSEMPSSWSLEAQKAQAIAARTFVKYTGTKHKIYDLCDNTNCQDYNGTAKETEIGRKAVDETAGKIAYYDNKPIDAVYFSSDGGATLSSEDVWVSAIPYLVGKKDQYEKECKQWSRSYTYSDITTMCNAKGFNIGTVSNVKAEYNENGVCMSITFTGSKGSKTVTKEEVRTVFSPTSEGSLPARNFVISGGQTTNIPSVHTIGKDGANTLKLNEIYAQNSVGEDNAIKNNTYTYALDGVKNNISTTTTGSNTGKVEITGKGFGHGVGMSQYGAKNMAEAGYNYIDILKYYYKGIEVK